MISLFKKNLHLLFVFVITEIFVFFLNYCLNDQFSSVIWNILGFFPFLIYLIAIKTSFQVIEMKKNVIFFILYNFFIIFLVFQCLFLVKVFTFHFFDVDYRKFKIDSLVQKELIKIKEIEDRKNIEVSYSKKEIQERIEGKFSVVGLFKSAIWSTIAFSILSIMAVFLMLDKQDNVQYNGFLSG